MIQLGKFKEGQRPGLDTGDREYSPSYTNLDDLWRSFPSLEDLYRYTVLVIFRRIEVLLKFGIAHMAVSF